MFNLSINLIACIDKNNALGYKNDLLVKLPNDLKRFKRLTTDNFVVMGKRTFQSIGHHLSERHNIVLTRKQKNNLPPDVFVYHSVGDVLREYENYADKSVELFIIGGESIYNQFLNHADRIYLTIVDYKFPKADTYFPRFDLSEWKPIENIYNPKDEKHEFDYNYVTYERRNKIDS